MKTLKTAGRCLAASAWLSTCAAPAVAANLPSGFSESLVAEGLRRPTAMGFAPDGRLFVCEQDGALRIVRDGALLPDPFVTLTVNASGERGLLGVAFHPDFDDNPYVYVYYTAPSPTIHNRVSRFRASGDLASGSEEVILELETLGAPNHNGGAIHFGLDGRLYVAVGDNAIGPNAQTLGNRLGKILRINADGTIPSDNPFYLTATGANRSIWALGLRNPFTFSQQPVTGTMFINDVGEVSWEEINRGLAGANFGWPTTEGPTSDPRFTGPVHAYDHAEGCAISGGTFYDPTTAQFPGGFVHSYFFSDFCGGWIRLRSPLGSVSEFASGISAPVDLQVSSDGSLYYLSRGFSAFGGTVYRVAFDGPVVNVSANGADGPVVLEPQEPLQVALAFSPGTLPAVNPGEVYIAVASVNGWYWLDTQTDQDMGRFVPTVTRAYVGPVPAFGPWTLITLAHASMLVPGSYWWVMIVDNDTNGVPDGHFFDSVQTIVP